MFFWYSVCGCHFSRVWRACREMLYKSELDHTDFDPFTSFSAAIAEYIDYDSSERIQRKNGCPLLRSGKHP